jgi:hypothetical protein
MKTLFLLLLAVLLSSCAADGNLQFSADLTTLGIPAQLSYSSKNPIRSSK